MVLTRKELKSATDLKEIFSNIRNYLAGNVKGITRDETLAQEIINLLFCKIYDENKTLSDSNISFCILNNETEEQTKKRIEQLFKNVKKEYSDVFFDNEILNLDSKSIVYIVQLLQNYAITSSSREVIGEAFEAFIGPALRGGDGQFFTPKNVVEMTVDILNPQIGQSIIDPACGSGGFLTVALTRLWTQLEKQYQEKVDMGELQAKKEELASKYIRGIDKDRFLAKVTKAYLALIGDGRECIFCENSLDVFNNWSEEAKKQLVHETFDLVITNPPFGAKIPIKEEAILNQFELGYFWDKDQDSNWFKSEKLQDYQPPQILFIERCLQLLKIGGRMGIVLPDGLLGNISDGYIRKFLLEKTKILGVVDCPSETFQPSTSTKTSVLFLEKVKEIPKEDYRIFMSIVKNCGHDRRGRENRLDEFPSVVKKFRLNNDNGQYDSLGFFINLSDIKKSSDLILAPKYYNPEIRAKLEKLRKSGKYELISFNKLIEDGLIKMKRGNEVGSKYYGLGEIPFIRTSDISNWEIRLNPDTGIDEEVYNKYSGSQDLKPEDILFVNDGGRMVGEVAIITPEDGKIIIQSHIKRIRIIKNNLVNPYLLLYLFKMPVVSEQIESKRFVQATIPSLGNRLGEIIFPIPREKQAREEITKLIKNMISKRAEMKKEVFDFMNKEQEK